MTLLSTLIELDEKATAGPWIVTPDKYRAWSEPAATIVVTTAHNYRERTKQAEADCESITALRNALPRLLAALRAGEAQNEALKFCKKHAVFGVGMIQEKPWDMVNEALAAYRAATAEEGQKL